MQLQVWQQETAERADAALRKAERVKLFGSEFLVVEVRHERGRGFSINMAEVVPLPGNAPSTLTPLANSITTA